MEAEQRYALVGFLPGEETRTTQTSEGDLKVYEPQPQERVNTTISSTQVSNLFLRYVFKELRLQQAPSEKQFTRVIRK